MVTDAGPAVLWYIAGMEVEWAQGSQTVCGVSLGDDAFLQRGID